MKKLLKKLTTVLMVCALVCCTLMQTATLEAKKFTFDPEKAAKLSLEAQQNLASPQFSSGGASHTHQYIITQALTILRHDKGSSVLNNWQGVLQEYTDWPDKVGNETDNLTFQGHFYNPYTEKNFLGSKTKTALVRAVDYLDAALSDYFAGNMRGAMENLGKGTHYVSDLNEPHHASNLTAVNSNHSAFEKYVDQNRTSFYISGNTFGSSVYTEAKSRSMRNVLRDGAFYAYDLQYLAQDKNTYYEAGQKCVQHAITNVTQYLYAFAYDAGIMQ